MKKASEQTCFLFFALSLTIILADYDIIENAFSNDHIITLNECSGTSIRFEHSHSIYFEDDIFITEPKVISTEFDTGNGLIHTLKFHFKNSFTANIWQPPRFS
jgi:hypothetical protein